MAACPAPRLLFGYLAKFAEEFFLPPLCAATCPEEASIITSNNLILFLKENLVFLRGTNGGTEKILLSCSFPDPNSIHTVPVHFFLFHGKPNLRF
jgi:hypothetical protein